jgi:O-antigen/teichoic acid export membrane protein
MPAVKFSTESPVLLGESPRLRLEMPSLLSIFGRNAFWLWIDRGLLAVGTLLAGLILVRYLGPTSYGLYSLAISAGATAGSFLDLGLTRYAARAIAAGPQAGPSILAASFTSTLTFLFVSIVALVGFAHWHNWAAECVSVGLVIGILQRLATICAFFLTAELRSSSVLAGSFLSRIATIVITVTVVVKHLSLLSLLIGIAGLSIPVVSVRLWQLRHYWPSRNDWEWNRFTRTVRQAWPFMSYSWTETGYSQLSIICLGLVATKQEVGWFAAALVITSIFPQWTYASNDALLPIMTRLFEAQRIDVLTGLRDRILDLFLIVSIPVSVGLCVFATEICAALGPRFVSSAPVLRLLAGCATLSVMGGLLGSAVLMAINRVTARRNAVAMTLIALALLTLSLGRIWGSKGAGVALLVADTVVLIQYIRMFSVDGWSLRSGGTLLFSVVAGCVMFLTCLLAERVLFWPVSLVLGVCAYFGFLSAFGRNCLGNAGRTLRECGIGTIG